MSGPVELQSPRLISEAEWRKLRLDSLRFAPRPDRDGIPSVLLTYQQRLLNTTSSHAITVCEKSRRTGMTWAAGADAVLTSSSAKSSGGMDTLYCGYNLDMAREFIDVCAMWAKVFDQATTAIDPEQFLFDEGGEEKAIAAFRIKFASGFEIIALASRPRSFRGRQGYAIIDEAAFHDDLEAVMKAATAFLMWGGKILVISTHNGEDHYFNQLVKSIRGGKNPAALLRIDFDEALHEGLYERICYVQGKTWTAELEAKWRAEIMAFYGDAADEELFCIPREGGGVFLPGPLVEARARQGVPVLRLQRSPEFTHWAQHLREADIADWCERELLPLLKALDPALTHCMGADYGRVSDLTVLWPLAIQRTLKRTTPFVVEMRGIPFDQQKQVQNYLIRRLPKYSASKHDATGLGMSLAESAAQEFGLLRAEPVMLSVLWYRENAQPLKTAFEDDMIEIPADADIASDLRAAILKNGVASIPAIKNGQNKDRHGDAFVALLLAYAASRAIVPMYGYESLRTIAEDGRGDDDDQKSFRRGLY